MAKASAVKLPGIEVGQITNFSGGPNFRDSPTELAATESYDAYNVTFDERGGVQSRLGYAKRNASPLGAGYKAQVLLSSPSLYWRLDEGVGSTTALDASGSGHTGSYGTGVTLGQAGALTGDSDKAASFNGTVNAQVASTYQPFVVGSQRTFMGWINAPGSAFDLNVFDAGTTFPCLTYATGHLEFRTAVSRNVIWGGLSLGQWTHWALTYDDTTKIAELFINGVSQGQQTISLGYQSNGNFTLGGSQAGGFNALLGSLDEVAVFESILPAAAILAIYNAATNGGDLIVNDYYSPLLGVTITQCGQKLYKADSTIAVKTFSTSGCVTFAELGGKVVVGHPADGLWTSTDGSTWTKVSDPDAPTTANCICTWMGKLFVGMADGTVHWSAASDPTTWLATDFNAIWTKDQKPIVALAIGSGQDIQGRPGLLVFKQESVYRINDSGTGAYTVLDTSHGAGGPKAVVGVGARVCWIGKGGIWWWREDQASPINGSDLLRPLWREEQLSFNIQSGWAAGRRLNRARFSVSTLTSTTNDLSIEFHPDEGWATLGSDAMTCYSVDANENTYGGSPTAPGQMYQLDIGGTDDSQTISGHFQTRWLVPNGGFQAQVWQARLHGRGSGTLEFRKDYQDSGSDYDFDFLQGGFQYDNGVLYDAGNVYVDIASAASESFAGLGVCRQFSLRFIFSADSTVSGRQIGTAPVTELGEFAIYSVETLFVPLGLS